MSRLASAGKAARRQHTHPVLVAPGIFTPCKPNARPSCTSREKRSKAKPPRGRLFSSAAVTREGFVSSVWRKIRK
jgi:hypothetical protein